MLAEWRENRKVRRAAELRQQAASWVESYEEQVRKHLAEVEPGQSASGPRRCHTAPYNLKPEQRDELLRLSGADVKRGERWEQAVYRRIVQATPGYKCDPVMMRAERETLAGVFGSEVRAAARAAKENEAARRAKEAKARKELRQIAMRRTHSHVRRTRELQAHGEHSTAEWLLKLEEFGGCCAYCGAGGDMTRDHFVPISRGGSNYIENIVPACGSCNSSKRDKTGAEFMAWLRQRFAAGEAAS